MSGQHQNPNNIGAASSSNANDMLQHQYNSNNMNNNNNQSSSQSQQKNQNSSGVAVNSHLFHPSASHPSLMHPSPHLLASAAPDIYSNGPAKAINRINFPMGGALSSSNGGVGSLLQQIEQQSEKQSNAGETEQNDYFLDFINANPTNAVGQQTPAASLFLPNQQQQQQQQQQQNIIGMGLFNMAGISPSLGPHRHQTTTNLFNLPSQLQIDGGGGEQPLMQQQQILTSSGGQQDANILTQQMMASMQQHEQPPPQYNNIPPAGLSMQKKQRPDIAAVAKKTSQYHITKSQSANNLTLMSRQSLQSKMGAPVPSLDNTSQFGPQGSQKGGTRRKGKQQDKQQELALSNQLSSQSKIALNVQPPSDDVTIKSQLSGRSRRGRIPKNKSFGYLETLRKEASAMVTDLIPMSDATSNQSKSKRKPAPAGVLSLNVQKQQILQPNQIQQPQQTKPLQPQSAVKQQTQQAVSLSQNLSTPVSKGRKSKQSNSSAQMMQSEQQQQKSADPLQPQQQALQNINQKAKKQSKKQLQQKTSMMFDEGAQEIIGSDLFMNTNPPNLQQQQQMQHEKNQNQQQKDINVAMITQQREVAFNLPQSRGRSRSKNHSSSIDSQTQEKKKRGRRSQSDSTKRQEQRLAKNRISAANSRKRRKKYIEQLEEKVMENEQQRKELIRLKTIVEGQKKQLSFQEPIDRSSADQFFVERIDDLVKVEKIIVAADEQQTEVDQSELQTLIQRLDIQSGPYGSKRKELLSNLFKSIVEMALPGFIEYLFYGYEQNESGTGFFNPQNYEHEDAAAHELTDQRMGGSDQQAANNEASNEESYEHEVLGFDPMTGKEFTRVRKRKPMRYYLPGLIGGSKNPESIKQYKESLKWLHLNQEQKASLQAKSEKITSHYKNFKKLFETLMQTKEKILVEMEDTDQTVNEMKNMINAEQMAKFLLLSDKIKLKQEFDMFKLWETRQNKKITPVYKRLEQNQDGHTYLRRPQIHEQSYDESMQDLVVEPLTGLQKIGDLEEVCEDLQNQSDQSVDSEERDDMMILDDDGSDDEENEQLVSSDVSKDINKIKSILKNNSNNNKRQGAGVGEIQIQNLANQPNQVQMAFQNSQNASAKNQQHQRSYEQQASYPGGKNQFAGQGYQQQQVPQSMTQQQHQQQFKNQSQPQMSVSQSFSNSQNISSYNNRDLHSNHPHQQQMLQQQMMDSHQPSHTNQTVPFEEKKMPTTATQMLMGSSTQLTPEAASNFQQPPQSLLYAQLQPQQPQQQQQQEQLGATNMIQQTALNQILQLHESSSSNGGNRDDSLGIDLGGVVNYVSYQQQQPPQQQISSFARQRKEKVFPDDSSNEEEDDDAENDVDRR